MKLIKIYKRDFKFIVGIGIYPFFCFKPLYKNIKENEISGVYKGVK